MQNSFLMPAGTKKLRQVAFWNVLTIANNVAIFFTVAFLGCCRQCHDKLPATDLNSPIKPACTIDTKYPAWFFNPPRGTVAGYYHDSVTSLSDAKIRAAGYHSMRFYGKFRYYEDERTHDFQDSISFYFIEPDTALYSLQIADSFFMCCTKQIYLLSEKNVMIDTSRVDACTYSTQIKDQSNIRKINANGEYRFEYYNQSLCWMHAEENAVKELCNQALHRFASLRKKTESEMSTTIMKQFDLSIKNIVIEKRTFDTENNICRVTISCDTADIIPILSNEVAP